MKDLGYTVSNTRKYYNVECDKCGYNYNQIAKSYNHNKECLKCKYPVGAKNEFTEIIESNGTCKIKIKCVCGVEKQIQGHLFPHYKSCGCKSTDMKTHHRINRALERKTIIHNGYVELELTGGEYTLVDTEDYDKIKNNCWYKSVRGNVESRLGKGLTKLHRYVLNYSGDKYVDHINGNQLDNRKSNLRLCVNKQNSYNKHVITGKVPYKGVQEYKKGNGFMGVISKDGKTKSKTFKTAIDAAKWYDMMAIQMFGEFAKTNKQLNNYEIS